MSAHHPQTTFVDGKGAEWTLRFCFADRKRFIDDVSFDPFKVFENDFADLAAVNADPERLGRALFLLLEKPLQSRGLTWEQFLERVDGPTLSGAAVALARAIVDFFQEPRRSMGHALLDKGIEAVPVLGSVVATRIAKIPVASLRSESNDSAGDAPTSSDAPPDPGPSENSSNGPKT